MPGICLCALCRSADFHIEIGAAGFRTMADARPALLETELKQRLTQMWLKAHRN
jgi:hypothetical protein